MSSQKPEEKIYADVSGLELISQEGPTGFHYLELRRLHLRNHYPDGRKSKEYTYETCLRRNFDAVGILLFSRRAGDTTVHLRRTLRPPLVARQALEAKPGEILATKEKPILLEIIAGLLEDGEISEANIRSRAVAEVWEEAGLLVVEGDLISLGAPVYPTPGMNPERIFLYAAQVDVTKAGHPRGDGSPTEEIGGLVSFSLAQALAACVEGAIQDGKTEISLNRLSRR